MNRTIADLQVETETLTVDLAAREQQLESVQAQLAESDRRVAELATERETLAAAVDQRQQSLAATEAQLESARQQSEAFQTALEQLRVQTGWLAQVAGYHLGYAGQPREVEVRRQGSSRTSQALSKWLSGQLGREIVIPDLVSISIWSSLAGGCSTSTASRSARSPITTCTGSPHRFLPQAKSLQGGVQGPAARATTVTACS